MMGHGFLLPEREIVPTGLETFESIKVVADELVAQFVEPVIRAKLTTTTRPCEFPSSCMHEAKNSTDKSK